MKILYHHRIRSKDGQAVHLDGLIGALRSQGHEVLLVGPRGFADSSFGHESRWLGIAKRIVPKAIYEILELAYNVPAYFRLRRACADFHADFIYERYNLYLLAGVWLGRRLRIPLLLEVNAPLARERAEFGGLGLPLVARLIERRVWRSADRILPVTAVLADEIRAVGVPTARITVIPNGIDLEQFANLSENDAAKRQLGLSGKLVLGFTGFVRDWHGLDSVVTLLAESNTSTNLHLLLVGEGPAIGELKIQAQTLGVLNRVTFAGLVDRNRLATYVAAFDVAILPKCVSYCSPLKLFEYMGAGKAVVAPDQANIREILESGFSCILFSPDGPDSMSSAVLRLSEDGLLRERLGKAARDLIDLRGYTWTHNAARVSAIGSSAANEKRSHAPPNRP